MRNTFSLSVPLSLSQAPLNNIISNKLGVDSCWKMCAAEI